MRKIPLISITFLGLALTFGLAACDGDDGDVGADTTESGDGDGDGEGDGDGDGDSCFQVPDECLLFIQCIDAIVPSQSEMVAADYGEGGSCWCGDEPTAQACFKTCVDQVAAARKTQPTVSACHDNSCGLDELDATQPYGPVVDGACPDWDPGQGTSYDQVPLNAPFGLPGSVCSPPCTGIANVCPEHPQTSSQGTCYLAVGQQDHCVMRCYVNPDTIGGTQCQCGATCQPHGPVDGDMNQRGVCTFE